MSIDQQIQDYFQARSGDVSTSSTPVRVIVERGRRRHRRRNAARVGALGGVMALTGVVAAQGFRGDTPQEVDTAAQRNVPTDLDWTVVTPEQGISWSPQVATASDGSIYAVATAPAGGLTDKNTPALYRSTDQQQWEQVALPDGLTPSGLASAGDRIYAVGTSPQGGNVDRVELASSSTGSTAAAWDGVEVPLDLSEREAASGLDISVRAVRVATVGDRTVVAVSTRASGADLEPFVPDDRADWMPIDATAEGLLGSPARCFADPTVGGAEAGVASSDGVDADGAPRPEDAPPAPGCEAHEVLPWADTEATEAQQRELVGGTIVLATDGDGTFDVVHTIAGTGSTTVLQSDEAGVWLATDARSTALETQFWHSTDGTTWTAVGAPYDGSVLSQGTLQGRAAFGVIVDGVDGARPVPSVLVAGAGGLQRHEVPVPEGTWPATAVVFGPLGAAGVVSTDDGTGQLMVVHSRDLVSWSTVPVEAGERLYATGLTVSADAITVRLSDRSDIDRDDFDTPSVARIFVGTPR